MLSHELHHVCQSDGSPGCYSSANASMRGRGGGSGGCFNGRGRGRGHGNGHSSGSGSSNSKPPPAHSSDGRPRYQVCLLLGHTTNICWYLFDEDYELEQKTVAVVSTSHGANHNWYLDSGTIDHITGELDKLTTHDRYHDTDQVKTTNGIGMPISRIGSSVIPTIHHNLCLNNVLHVPGASKHLISIRRFNLDNHTYIELHPRFFLIKDHDTRKVVASRAM
jgi:hypothetical protein